MRDVVIASAARTPVGMYMKTLADQRSQDLAAISMKEAMTRSGIDSTEVDVCIYSEAKQSSFPASVGRHGWLLAGLSEDTAGFTMNTLCAGALQTMVSAYNKILAGEYSAIMAGGIETNSQAQHYLVHPRYRFGPDNFCFHDSKVDVEINAQPSEIYGELKSVDLADKIAESYGFARSAVDDYAWKSRTKTLEAVENGNFKECIAPIAKMVKKEEIMITADDGRKKTSLEELAKAASANPAGTATAENVAALADGSASWLILSADKAAALGCTPLGKIIGFGIAAGNPTQLDKTAVKSIEKALQFAGLTLKDLDFIDFHEPSAAYGLALTNQLGQDIAGKVNVDGGSLGLGHAGAATGGILATNLIYRLQRTGGRYGLVNVGALGGQSLSVLIAR